MIKKLLREDMAQGAIVYILLAGGVIVAAVAVFSIYSSMSKSIATSLEETSDDAVSGILDKTQEVLLEPTEANGKNKSTSKGSSKEKKK